MRRECGVAVGRDIPVIGHAQFQAATAVQPHARRQPSTLAVIAERKTQHRQAQDGHPQKLQHRTLGHAHMGFEVELHALGAQQPVGLAGSIAGAA